MSKLRLAQQAFKRKDASSSGSLCSKPSSVQLVPAPKDLYSDFEYSDDFIDEEEEYGGSQQPVKFSIKCFGFHVLISGRPLLDFFGQASDRKVSMLSRASSLIMSGQINQVNQVK
jgi:hypothetical protein